MNAFGIAWRLGLTLFFVALNGFFVAAEFALVKVRSSRIDELAGAGAKRAKVVQHILEHLDRYLSSCQLGITLASLILGALGEPAVSVLIIAAAGAVGLTITPGVGWLPIVSIGLAFAVITMLHMTVGEQAPKMWALRKSESTSMQTAYPLKWFTFLFRPFIVAVNGISNWMLRLAGMPAGSHDDVPTAEEIRSILAIAARSGHISDREYELTENVFRVMSLEVRHIVVPRIDVRYLTLEKSLEDNLQSVRQANHSRLPLCEVGLDGVVGFVHTKDILGFALDNKDVNLRAIAHEPIFVSDTMSVSNFLLELQNKQYPCAVVLDERGTAIGLAFREDALEEIVGPLGDEFDEMQPVFREVEPGIFECSGRLSFPEALDRLDIELTSEEEEGEDTIGGHVTARLGRLPKAGDEVRVGSFLVTVLDATRKRARRLRLERVPAQNDDDRD